MKKTYFIVIYSYCAGNLGTDFISKNEKEILHFEETYKKDFSDCNKGFITYQIEEISLFGIVIKKTIQKIREWNEEE